ncbi:hypothetical protein GBF38_009250, partial [Nibea albiflora]
QKRSTLNRTSFAVDCGKQRGPDSRRSKIWDCWDAKRG